MLTSCADSRLPAWSDRLRRALLGLLVASGTTAARASAVPERLSVEPGEIRLDGGDARQQVAVTGHFADGSVRDLTAEASFAVEPTGMARASKTGVVTPGGDGPGSLRVEAGGKTDRGPDPGRRGGSGAAGELSAGRGGAAVEGRVQRGGLPRQPQRQGGLPAQPPGRRPDVRPGLADPRRLGPPGRPDPARRGASSSSSRRGGSRTRGARGSPPARPRSRRCSAGSRRAPWTTPRPRRGRSRLTVFPAERMIAAPGPGAAARRHGRVRRRLAPGRDAARRPTT